MIYEELTKNMDQDRIWTLITRTHDQRSYCGFFKVAASSIHGLGVFTMRHVQPGDEIGPARLDGKRTPIGRYTNHAAEPNCEMIRRGQDLYVIARKEILHNREVTLDYQQVLQVNTEAPEEWK
jgi:hypothetical protein